MQTISIRHVQAEKVSQIQRVSFSKWLKKIVAASEQNRFGVVTTLILLQVSIAGLNVVISPMTGASVSLMAPGIFMAFMSNSIALAKAKMKWVLFGFALSMVINTAVSIYCFAQL